MAAGTDAGFDQGENEKGEMIVGRLYYGVAGWLIRLRDRGRQIPGQIFDARHGTDTAGTIPVTDLDIPFELKQHAVRYQPTAAALFSHVIEKLPIASFSDYAFVDLGCGKGRCLLMAADAGFAPVVGVDVSETLCGIARHNVSRFRGGRHERIVDIQHLPAAKARLPRRPSVYFFYNPFDETQMAETLNTISELLDQTGDEAFLVYVNPRHTAVVADKNFELVRNGRNSGEDWTIWHRAGRPKESELK